MIQMTAGDDSLLKDLSVFVEPVEVLDKAGKVLGLFVPAETGQRNRLAGDAGGRIDWAEIERRHAQERGQGRRLYEIFEHLKTLTSDPEERADLQVRHRPASGGGRMRYTVTWLPGAQMRWRACGCGPPTGMRCPPPPIGSTGCSRRLPCP